MCALHQTLKALESSRSSLSDLPSGLHTAAKYRCPTRPPANTPNLHMSFSRGRRQSGPSCKSGTALCFLGHSQTQVLGTRMVCFFPLYPENTTSQKCGKKIGTNSKDRVFWWKINVMKCSSKDSGFAKNHIHMLELIWPIPTLSWPSKNSDSAK